MSEGDNLAKLVPTRPEAVVAAEFKERAKEALAALCAIMDECAAHGLMIQFDQIERQPLYFRYDVTNLRVVKHY